MQEVIEMAYSLKQARVLKEKTQLEMANALNVCRDTYRSIEANPDQATILQAKTICKFLEMELEDINFFAE